jgi:hypothetical protein
LADTPQQAIGTDHRSSDLRDGFRIGIRFVELGQQCADTVCEIRPRRARFFQQRIALVRRGVQKLAQQGQRRVVESVHMAEDVFDQKEMG